MARRKITTREAARILAMAPHHPPEMLAKELGMTLKQYAAFVERRKKEAWAWAEAQAQGQFVHDAENACVRLDYMTGRLVESFVSETYTIIDPESKEEITVKLTPAQLAGLAKSIADIQSICVQLSGSAAYKALDRARTRYLNAEDAATITEVSAAPGSPPLRMAIAATVDEPKPESDQPKRAKKKRRGRRGGARKR